MGISDLRVYIPTRGRVGVQKTWGYLPESVRKLTKLVIDPDDEPGFKRTQLPYVVCPEKGITHVRRWIIEKSAHEKIIMMDDDLRFAKRTGEITIPEKSGVPTHHYVTVDGEALVPMFEGISEKLEDYAHVSIAFRQFSADKMVDWYDNTRQMRILCYRKSVIKRHVVLGRVEIMEDFDITLQLLRAGYPNTSGYTFVQDQTATQAPGGCSTYRTHELHDREARKLAELHAPFVQLRQKVNKSKIAGAFGTRTEVTINWKSALASAGEVRRLR